RSVTELAPAAPPLSAPLPSAELAAPPALPASSGGRNSPVAAAPDFRGNFIPILTDETPTPHKAPAAAQGPRQEEEETGLAPAGEQESQHGTGTETVSGAHGSSRTEHKATDAADDVLSSLDAWVASLFGSEDGE